MLSETWQTDSWMSGLIQKADIDAAGQQVSKVPKANIWAELMPFTHAGH
jgi:hypothetical protein